MMIDESKCIECGTKFIPKLFKSASLCPKCYNLKKIYIVGYEHRNFDTISRKLAKKGYKAVFPEFFVKEASPEFKLNLKILLDCQAVYLLENWSRSFTSRIEVYLAEKLGYTILDESEK